MLKAPWLRNWLYLGHLLSGVAGRHLLPRVHYERHDCPSCCICDDQLVDQRISLVTLGVTDLARARSFYEALGWRDAQQPDDEVCFFQAGGMVFGLWTALGGHGAPGIELAHNVRSPEEVGAVLAEAQQAGGTVLRPAARAEWGGTSGAFADPDGYVWEVAHNPGWTLGEDGSVRM